jgi:hypothetical protein
MTIIESIIETWLAPLTVFFLLISVICFSILGIAVTIKLTWEALKK